MLQLQHYHKETWTSFNLKSNKETRYDEYYLYTTFFPFQSILAIGELGSMNNVYKASLTCMMAGSDFIKTSTGKEGVNATLPVGVVMCRYCQLNVHM